MIVFRLSKGKYKNDLSGKGAEIAGGRWNSKGTAILYTGENRALCTAELAVHLPLGIVPLDYHLLTIEIPKVKIELLDEDSLPDDWNTFLHSPSTKKYGDEFIKANKKLVLKVPSAVVQGEFNYLINPSHLKFKSVKIINTEAFRFDKRLFVR